MRVIKLFAATIFLFAACLGCGGDNQPVIPVETAVKPDLARELPGLDLLANTSVERTTSYIFQLDAWNDLILYKYKANAERVGDSIRLPSEPGEISYAIYAISIEYGGDGYWAPYMVPKSFTINTQGSGKYWVALADFKKGYWRYQPGELSGAARQVEVGLEKNSGNRFGVFWFALITYNGESVTFDSFDFDFPDRGFGDPIAYEEWVDTPDGEHLATETILPHETGLNLTDPQPPYPVLLIRTPYDKEEIKTTVIQTPFGDFTLADALDELHIILVLQYFRGRIGDTGELPDSTGIETWFRDHAGPEFKDAITAVNWIESRNFYSGDLILAGPSAMGLWIYQALPELGNRVKAVYPIVSAGNTAEWAAFENGCYKRGNIVNFALVNGWLDASDPENVVQLVPFLEANIYNKSYRNAVDFDKRALEVRAPGFHETGWWDMDVEATIKSWKELNVNGGSGAQDNQWLMIGPWAHNTVRQDTTGEITFPTSSNAVDPTYVPNNWDGYLFLLNKLNRNPLFVEPDDHVRYYMVGAEGSEAAPSNHWYTSDDWPPISTETSYYLSGGANGLVTSGQTEGSETWLFEPLNCPWTRGGPNYPQGEPRQAEAGMYDQTIREESWDYMIFTSVALASKVPIVGPIIADLYVSTDAVDTDVMIKLIDEYPDGRRMLVADTGVRLSWYVREVLHQGEVVPGTVYPLNFDIAQRAYVFEAGHKISIALQGGNDPRFAINPGDGNDLLNIDSPPPVNQNTTVYFGGSQASRIILPVFDPS